MKKTSPRTLAVALSLVLVSLGVLYLARGANVCQMRSLKKTREAVLHQDLSVMRQAIDNYTLDNQRPPQSLKDLVNAGYIREVPTDPLTMKKDWVVAVGDIELSQDFKAWGLYDVHSALAHIGADRTAYDTW